MTGFVYALDATTRRVLASMPCACLPPLDGLTQKELAKRMKPYFVRANALREHLADSAVFEVRDL